MRIACARVMELAKSALAAAPCPADTCSGASPSGCRPKSSGARRTIKAMGSVATAAPNANNCQEARQPNRSTDAVASIGKTMPESEIPMPASATARPRRSTNHLPKVTFTTRLPIIAAPAVSASPLSKSHWVRVSTLLRANSEPANSKPPIKMKRLPPCLSIFAPMKKPVNAMTN